MDQECYTGNQSRNLSIAIEMTQISNGNDKFKGWKEDKIIENEHICKSLVPHTLSGAFIVNFGHIWQNLFLLLLLILTAIICFYFEQVNNGWEH